MEFIQKIYKTNFFIINKNAKNHHFVNIIWSENWNKKWSSLKLIWIKKLFFTVKLAKTSYISVLDIPEIDENVIEVIAVISQCY